MLELVVIACLASDPAACEEHRVLSVAAKGIGECKLSGGPHVADWVRDNPDLIVRRWTCKPLPDMQAGA